MRGYVRAGSEGVSGIEGCVMTSMECFRAALIVGDGKGRAL